MTKLWLLFLLLHAVCARKLTKDENEKLKQRCSSVMSSVARVKRRQPINHSEYPFAAALTFGGTQLSPLYGCSGVLISPRHVLTAAHCLYEDFNRCSLNQPPLKQPPQNIRIYFKCNSNNEYCWANEKCYTTKTVIIHPYNKPCEGDTKEYPSYDIGTRILHSIRYHHIEEEEEKSIAAYNISKENDFVRGDSGGPFIQKVGGKYYLFGIASQGEEGSLATREPKAGAVFADIRKHLHWICIETGVCSLPGTNSHQWEVFSQQPWLKQPWDFRGATNRQWESMPQPLWSNHQWGSIQPPSTTEYPMDFPETTNRQWEVVAPPIDQNLPWLKQQFPQRSQW